MINSSDFTQMRPFAHGFKMKPLKEAVDLPSSPRTYPHPTTQLLDTKKFCLPHPLSRPTSGQSTGTAEEGCLQLTGFFHVLQESTVG